MRKWSLWLEEAYVGFHRGSMYVVRLACSFHWFIKHFRTVMCLVVIVIIWCCKRISFYVPLCFFRCKFHFNLFSFIKLFIAMWSCYTLSVGVHCLWSCRPGGGGTWVFFGWVCAARDSKLAPRSKKKIP